MASRQIIKFVLLIKGESRFMLLSSKGLYKELELILPECQFTVKSIFLFIQHFENLK